MSIQPISPGEFPPSASLNARRMKPIAQAGFPLSQELRQVYAEPEISQSVKDRAMDRIKKGDKIGAISFVRAECGLGLAEAKSFVEGL